MGDAQGRFESGIHIVAGSDLGKSEVSANMPGRKERSALFGRCALRRGIGHPSVRWRIHPSAFGRGPFRVRDVNLTIPRGQLVAIVGPVGSGKVVCF